MFTIVLGLVLILIKFYIFFLIHLNRSECVFLNIFHFIFYTDFHSPLFLYRIFFSLNESIARHIKKKSKPHTFFGYLQNDQSYLIRKRSSNSMSKQLFRMFFFCQFFKKRKKSFAMHVSFI